METVKLTMLQSQLGSPNGTDVHEYEAGQAYELPVELADVFLAEGWATKSAGRAPENKDAGAAPANKAAAAKRPTRRSRKKS